MSRRPLTIENLSVTYRNGFRAITELSLTIDHEERLAVVGASGSGKTTLVRAIMGLLPRTAVVTGRILVDNTDLTTISRRERRLLNGRTIGYVSQDPFSAFDPLRRVRHHIHEAWSAHGAAAPPDGINAGLARMGIPDPARRSRQWPHQWSGGMLQRATTLAATVHDPVLTLADEPTSALDTELADDALDLLRRTCSALLLVTHDLALAGRHTDRIAVFHDGKIVEHAGSECVLEHPRHEITRALIRAARPLPRPARTDRTSAEVILRAENITKSYSTRHGVVTAVHPTSLEIRAGEVIGVVGPSGSGKSTLLRLLAGMERPDSGEIVVDGRPMWGAASRTNLPRKGFAMPVFQDPVGSLDPRWPLWRSLTEPLVLAGVRLSKQQRREHASEALASLDMSEIDADRLPGTLSVGQCQRVAVLRGLIAGPALIAADEPTASLDVEVATAVSNLLRAAADAGAVVLVVSHDEARVRAYADHILTVREGIVAASEAKQ